MSEELVIRRYKQGEEAQLFDVHYSAIHLVARHYYSEEQIQAWAPPNIDLDMWKERIQSINPFVAELNGKVLGYADLQASGYIDHFFVSGEYPHQGVGKMLMKKILEEARKQGLNELTSDASKAAQGFYEKFGFQVVEYRTPVRNGIEIPNAFMRRNMNDY